MKAKRNRRLVWIGLVEIIFLYVIASTIIYNKCYHIKNHEMVVSIEISNNNEVKVIITEGVEKWIDALNNHIYLSTIIPKEESGNWGIRFVDSKGEQIKWLRYDDKESRFYPLGGKASNEWIELFNMINHQT